MSVNTASDQIDLTGQVAIVTGGGRGIGRAMAQALARAGAAVAVISRTAEEVEQTAGLIASAGGRALAILADVADRPMVQEMVRQVERELGPVDLLVNNAGVMGPCGPAWEVDPDEWWRCLEVNLRGPYLCARAVLPGMVRRRSGRIITTASGAGLQAVPYASAYAIGKCAAIRLTENLAAEAREHGVSVFSIGPGFVRTAMTEGFAGSPEEEKWTGGMFGRRLAEGEDVPPERAAELVLMLASGKADALSGCFISINHDVDEMVARAEEIREEGAYTLRLRT